MFIFRQKGLTTKIGRICGIADSDGLSKLWMKGPNYIHCITGEINAVLGQMKLNTRYTSAQRFYKEIPMVVCNFMKSSLLVGNSIDENVQIVTWAN